MTTVLIADACKPSLVMSSEIFKDKIPGAIVLVAATGKDCLDILQAQNPDICVVDFDLPDADGVSLVAAMRKVYKGPILLTAYPDAVVSAAVSTELYAFNDASGWIRKPVKFDDLSAKIERFLLNKYRLGRRFDVKLKTQVVGKGAGRGKRSPKVAGKIVNLSLGGVCIEFDQVFKVKGGQEIVISLPLPARAGGSSAVEVAVIEASQTEKPSKATKPVKGEKTKKASRIGAMAAEADVELTLATAGPIRRGAEAKVKATVCWLDDSSRTAGLQFGKLTEVQRRGLENLLRELAVQADMA